MQIKRCKKGEYGYLNYMHFYSTMRAALVFAVAIIIFGLGYLYFGNKENIVTVVSVLTLLPASHMLVLCIMHWRFSTGDEVIYERVNDILTNDAPVFYDSVLTIDKGSAYQVDVFACLGKSLIGYSKSIGTNSTLIEKHIKTMLKQNQIEGVSVKIFTDIDAYIRRVNDLADKFDVVDAENSKSDYSAIALIKALSL